MDPVEPDAQLPEHAEELSRLRDDASSPTMPGLASDSDSDHEQGAGPPAQPNLIAVYHHMGGVQAGKTHFTAALAAALVQAGFTLVINEASLSYLAQLYSEPAAPTYGRRGAGA